jgi:hemolysin activation/secretion protein
MNTSTPQSTLIIGAFCLLAAVPALAQDAGALLRDAESQRQATVPANPVLLAPVTPPPAAVAGPRFFAKKFHLEGNTLLSEAELQMVLAPWVGRELSFAELQQAANAITELYRRAGYLVRAYLPEQKLDSGTVSIIVIEARMGRMQIEDGGKELRLSKDVARDTLNARQKQGDAFSLDSLQRGINLVNDLPGAEATVILSPSVTQNQTDVIVKMMDKPLLSGLVQLDNNGSRSTGTDKLSASLSIDNPNKIGDQIQLAGAHTSGTDYLRLGYSLPLGSDGLRVGAHSSYLQYNIPSASNPTGNAATLGVNARYPILRGSISNLAVSGTLDSRSYINKAAGTVTSDKTVNIASIGLSGDRLDGFGGGGFSFASVFLSMGQLDLSSNAGDFSADQANANRNGTFNKLTWNAGRLQKIGMATNLWLSANGQFANKNLDSSEAFALGGPAGVRAYPNMEGTGDQGWLLTAEVRQNLNSKLMLAGFYDYGRVLQHKNEWTGWNAGTPGQPGTYDLSGFGLALTWTEPGNYMAKLVLARRAQDNPAAQSASGNDGDDSKVLNRVWLNVAKYF